jgi:autophagy-related protein 11
MLEVEDWTQPSHNKKRLSSKRISGDVQDGKEGGPSKPSSSVLPPGPPEPEVEDTFIVTHPANSHLFPSRKRSNSTPAAKPSSLSRLLAQASPTAEGVNDSSAEKPPSPRPVVLEVLSTSPQKILLTPSTTTHNSINNGNTTINGGNLSPATNTPPLRPGSRASRLSTASRFSVSRKPTLGIVAGSLPKAAATTALSEQILAQSPSPSTDHNPFRSPLTSSPDESISEAMSNTMEDIGQRRRTTSYHPPRIASTSSQATVVPRPTSAASTTLANLANSLGMSFGRKKKADLAAGMLTPPVESQVDATSTSARAERQVLNGTKSIRGTRETLFSQCRFRLCRTLRSSSMCRVHTASDYSNHRRMDQ